MLLSGESFVNTSHNNPEVRTDEEGIAGNEEEEDEGDDDKPSVKVDPVESLQHLRRLEAILEDFDYDGYDWTTVVNEPGQSATVMINGQEIRNDFYSDLDVVNQVFRGQFGLSKLKAMEQKAEHLKILEEFRFYHKHADVRSHQIVFRRCDVNECPQCKTFRRLKGYGKDYYKKLDLPPSSSGGLFFTQVDFLSII